MLPSKIIKESTFRKELIPVSFNLETIRRLLFRTRVTDDKAASPQTRRQFITPKTHIPEKYCGNFLRPALIWIYPRKMVNYFAGAAHL